MNRSMFNQPDGTTSLNPDELAGLKLKTVSTHHELNAAEQRNILEGEIWAFKRKRRDFLEEKFCRSLHKKMFGHVWTWSGTYRKSDKTIGVAWHQIPTEMSKILQDCRYWIENETYPMDEIAVRFHHRLVWIHPYPNGNGRWARTMADVLLFNLNQPKFTWGSKSKKDEIDGPSATRSKYIHALQMADAKKFTELIQFARS